MRAPALLIAVIFSAACSKHQPVPRKAVATCMERHATFWDGVATQKRTEPSSLSCPELYRQAACRDAWSRILEDKSPDLSSIVEPCTRAYCDKLGNRPRLCNAPPSKQNAMLVSEVEELDAAILKHETGDEQAARFLSRKAMVFRIITVSMEDAALDLPKAAGGEVQLTVRVTIDEKGAIELEGKRYEGAALEQELANRRKKSSELRLVIAADGKVEHRRVIEVLDHAKRAGITKIAFAVTPKDGGPN